MRHVVTWRSRRLILGYRSAFHAQRSRQAKYRHLAVKQVLTVKVARLLITSMVQNLTVKQTAFRSWNLVATSAGKRGSINGPLDETHPQFDLVKRWRIFLVNNLTTSWIHGFRKYSLPKTLSSSSPIIVGSCPIYSKAIKIFVIWGYYEPLDIPLSIILCIKSYSICSTFCHGCTCVWNSCGDK